VREMNEKEETMKLLGKGRDDNLDGEKRSGK
jgi:hypothetical protein